MCCVWPETSFTVKHESEQPARPETWGCGQTGVWGEVSTGLVANYGFTSGHFQVFTATLPLPAPQPFS